MVEVICAEDIATLQSCLKMRENVFVKEMNVPAEIERDEHDILGGSCCHFLIKFGGKPAGALRCMTDGTDAVLQRFCILKEYRTKGAGASAVAFVEEFLRSMGCKNIRLDAKHHACGFYEKCGYQKASDMFIEANVPHYKMIKEL